MTIRRLYKVALHSKTKKEPKAKPIFSWRGWATDAAHARTRALSALRDAWEALTAAHGDPGRHMPDELEAAKWTTAVVVANYAQYAVGTEWNLGADIVKLSGGLEQTRPQKDAGPEVYEAILERLANLDDQGPNVVAYAGHNHKKGGNNIWTPPAANAGSSPPCRQTEDVEAAAMAMATRYAHAQPQGQSKAIVAIDGGTKAASATLRAAARRTALARVAQATRDLRGLGLSRIAARFEDMTGKASTC